MLAFVSVRTVLFSAVKGDESVYVFEKDYDKAMLLLNDINAAEMEGE